MSHGCVNPIGIAPDLSFLLYENKSSFAMLFALGCYSYIVPNRDLRRRTHMKYKGTLIVVKDCNRALKFYRDLFGFQLLQDNDGNMELTDNLYLQELDYWEKFTKRSIVPNSNQSELYF